jgi:dihydrofolate synthase / folylpolyglutamate synthase
MLATKDCDGFLRNFTGLARRVIGVPIHQERTLPAAAIAAAAERVGIPADFAASTDAALAAIAALNLAPGPRIMVTGSLYLAGEWLAANQTPPL